MAVCPICNSKTAPTVTEWSFYCARCRHWSSSIKAEKSAIENTEFELSDENENVIDHLTGIRVAASERILNVLGEGAQRKLLDIGCAAGVFIGEARKRGFDACGIEPNKRMAAPGINRGLNIRIGFFPDALSWGEKFDLITFNDVFEHIEDIHAMLDCCHEKLDRGGCLSIAVPNSNGLFFRLAKTLAKIHICGPWNRLWQTMFYTPHLHYFSPDSLASCVEGHGFDKIRGPVPLPSITISGLWRRLTANKQSAFVTNLLIYIAVVLFFPIYAWMPKDSFFMIFKKNN